MYRINNQQDLLIKYLQCHSVEVFIEMATSLFSANKWSDNAEFILLNMNREKTAVVDVSIGMLNQEVNVYEYSRLHQRNKSCDEENGS